MTAILSNYVSSLVCFILGVIVGSVITKKVFIKTEEKDEKDIVN